MSFTTTSCATCGENFYPRKPTHRYCSNPCRAIARRTRAARVCALCGIAFTAHQSEIEKGGGKYCSRACFGAARQQTAAQTLARYRVVSTDPDACYGWSGTRNTGGYAVFIAGGRQQMAHRAAWEESNGPIPDGLFVCHHCDNPPCTRLAHLFLGTSQENTADKVVKGRQLKGERNGFATLTEDAVRVIRTRYATTRTSYMKLGREFGVSDQTIGRIVRGEAWAHVV